MGLLCWQQLDNTLRSWYQQHTPMNRRCRQLWYFPSRFYGNMAMQTVIVLNWNFNCYVLNRILIVIDQSYWNHVIIRINHGWVCIATPLCVVSKWGNTLRSWCQQHTPIHDWSLTYMMILMRILLENSSWSIGEYMRVNLSELCGMCLTACNLGSLPYA